MKSDINAYKCTEMQIHAHKCVQHKCMQVLKHGNARKCIEMYINAWKGIQRLINVKYASIVRCVKFTQIRHTEHKNTQKCKEMHINANSMNAQKL